MATDMLLPSWASRQAASMTPPSIEEEDIARLGENPAQPTSTSARLSGADYYPCSGNLQAFVTAGETINNSIHITESHLGAEG